MQRISCCLVWLFTAASLLAASAFVSAETWPLEIKQMDSRDASRGFSNRTEYLYRASYPQHFFLHSQPDGKGGVRFMGNDQQAAEFKKIVKKEPTYQSANPFRSVAKLGTQQYAFALDASEPEPKAEKKEQKAEKEEAKAKAEPKPDSAVAKLKAKLDKEKTKPGPRPIAFDRLYFDFNHNGDLTDDKVVEGKVQAGQYNPGNTYARVSFPRLDVTIDADGKPVESAVFLSANSQGSSNFNYTSVQINAAAYREGDITLEGKKRHVVLIDFNSNGRFDDEMKIREGVHGSEGQIYPEQGDMLLIDPEQNMGKSPFDSPYDVTSSSYRCNVAKLVNIDGRFYDLKITPAGDEISLSPSTVGVGKVTNPNDHFTALIYGDAGFFKISGGKDKPALVPEGEWKLLSYTITIDETPKPVEPKKTDEKKNPTGETVLDTLQKTLESYLGVGASRAIGVGRRVSTAAAQATAKYKPVKVVKDQTVEMPFGPPYKPVVTTQNYGDKTQLHMNMALVGSAGEICSNLMVSNGRPGKPEFTITDPKGEVVQKGSFEYG